ncbi:thioredoxin family protein [Alkalicoccobacillus porphyridii]|uniref:Thioredoxin family protein n=1 Tax=Alkalicoccobacillus porphyridii TaxID=2597270 RepID=A0A553ZT79_9BACI|nr:thioredoxin family protein [Alkalicoccobacillus porphyridii]TSB44672.1 thioredoxin family protein [Alkalicoccobacillus porphyridii]
MQDLNQWFEKGLSRYAYIHSMEVNQDKLLDIYNQFHLDQPERQALHLLQPKKLRALILTADWCGDAMVNLPVFMRIADEALIETRYFIRDNHLDLMDQYLTNGTSRAIPIIVVIDQEGHEVTTWGPRAPELEELVTERKSKLPDKEAPEYKESFKVFAQEMSSLYTQDPTSWDWIKNDILKTLQKTI